MILSTAIKDLQNTWLFRRKEESLSFFQIIGWWEIRRIPYNLIVGITGLLSGFIGFLLILLGSLRNPSLFPEPFGPVIMLMIYAIMANICYTGGWIIELAVTSIWENLRKSFGKAIFFWGTIFSVGLTLFIPLAMGLLFLVSAILGLIQPSN